MAYIAISTYIEYKLRGIMEIDRYSKMFKALASPHRLGIYMRLVNCCEPGTKCSTDASDQETCVGEVAEGLKLAPSTVSHHLKELRQAGLIEMEKQGQRSYCWVKPEALEELSEFLKPENGLSELKR